MGKRTIFEVKKQNTFDLFSSASDVELIDREIDRHRRCLGIYQVEYDTIPLHSKRRHYPVFLICQECGCKWETKFAYNPWYLFEAGYPEDLFEKEIREKFPQLDKIKELVQPRTFRKRRIQVIRIGGN